MDGIFREISRATGKLVQVTNQLRNASIESSYVPDRKPARASFVSVDDTNLGSASVSFANADEDEAAQINQLPQVEAAIDALHTAHSKMIQSARQGQALYGAPMLFPSMDMTKMTRNAASAFDEIVRMVREMESSKDRETLWWQIHKQLDVISIQFVTALGSMSNLTEDPYWSQMYPSQRIYLRYFGNGQITDVPECSEPGKACEVIQRIGSIMTKYKDEATVIRARTRARMWEDQKCNSGMTIGDRLRSLTDFTEPRKLNQEYQMVLMIDQTQGPFKEFLVKAGEGITHAQYSNIDEATYKKIYKRYAAALYYLRKYLEYNLPELLQSSGDAIRAELRGRLAKINPRAYENPAGFCDNYDQLFTEAERNRKPPFVLLADDKLGPFEVETYNESIWYGDIATNQEEVLAATYALSPDEPSA